VASPEDKHKLRCQRCGGGVRAVLPTATAAEPSEPSKPEGPQAAPDPPENQPANPPADDAWELDQQLQHIERVLGCGGQAASDPRSGGRQPVARLDPPHGGPAGCHLPPADRRAHRRKSSRWAGWSALLAVLSWTGLSLGTMTFACGAMLLGWSLVSQRQELWSLGLPIALGGQVALLVGLVLQLDRLWQESRHAAAKLDDVDQRLDELKTTTTMLGTVHGSHGSAFYSHMASGASPQLLLADLKGQLDLLAVKIAKDQ
jgi:hypothetical protein